MLDDINHKEVTKQGIKYFSNITFNSDRSIIIRKDRVGWCDIDCCKL